MDGNDDDELQAALALSMQPSTSDNNNSNNNTSPSMKRSNMDTSPPNNTSLSNNNSSSTEFNCKTFHKLMWNDNTTTTNDKERWIYECISTPSLSNNNSNSSGDSSGIEESCGTKPSIATSAAAMSTEKIMVESSKEQQESDVTTPLQIFTNSTISTNSTNTTSTTKQQPIWGLTQKHGGPCGVLASIQAEVIRILLFGRGSGNGELYYPFVPKANDNYVNCVSAPICDYEGMFLCVCCVLFMFECV